MYSFTIEFDRYKRTSPTLQDVSSIVVSGITIYSKNNKFGKFTKSKYVKKQEGLFMNVAGSNSYPVLMPIQDKVLLHIEGFPKEPKLEGPHIADKSMNDDYIFDHIRLTNVKTN